jgi:hypothetical protein
LLKYYVLLLPVPLNRSVRFFPIAAAVSIPTCCQDWVGLQ